jgi:hypothetical protein
MIYKCRRTATVISRNYNTLAILSEDDFKSLISEYPEYLKFLKASLCDYVDKKKKFLIKMVRKITYFNQLSVDTLHEIIYSLRPL